jgi:phosphoketolase
MNKNRTFTCEGNDIADNLLHTVEQLYVISPELRSEIINILVSMMLNKPVNKTEVKDRIEQLRTNMSCLNIFSQEFRIMINSELLLSLHKELQLDKTRNSGE